MFRREGSWNWLGISFYSLQYLPVSEGVESIVLVEVKLLLYQYVFTPLFVDSIQCGGLLSVIFATLLPVASEHSC